MKPESNEPLKGSAQAWHEAVWEMWMAYPSLSPLSEIQYVGGEPWVTFETDEDGSKRAVFHPVKPLGSTES